MNVEQVRFPSWFHSNFLFSVESNSFGYFLKIAVCSISRRSTVAQMETQEINVLLLDHSSFSNSVFGLQLALISTGLSSLVKYSIFVQRHIFMNTLQRKRKQVNFPLKNRLGVKAGAKIGA